MFKTWRVRCLWVAAACALALGARAAEKEATPQKAITVDLGGGVKLELVLIPAGSYQMGSEKGEEDEKPPHEVKIPKAFYMGKYEVTQEQWLALMRGNPSRFEAPKNPVDSVERDACPAFLDRLSKRVQRGRFTLPTEAEWEYACRAGSKTEYFFGEEGKEIGEYAWHGGNSGEKTHPVGEKKPNAWGLFDILGNVSEMCEDRIVRGGSFLEHPRFCRSAHRNRFRPSGGWPSNGLRVVLRNF